MFSNGIELFFLSVAHCLILFAIPIVYLDGISSVLQFLFEPVGNTIKAQPLGKSIQANPLKIVLAQPHQDSSTSAGGSSLHLHLTLVTQLKRIAILVHCMKMPGSALFSQIKPSLISKAADLVHRAVAVLDKGIFLIRKDAFHRLSVFGEHGKPHPYIGIAF